MSISKIVNLPTFGDERGKLTVAERFIPFDIKRVYYIYGAEEKRGGHRHANTHQALICINGSCEIYMNDGQRETTVLLDSPDKCLLLDKDEWHTMDKFTKGSILLVLSSTPYDVNDYIDAKYPPIGHQTT